MTPVVHPDASSSTVEISETLTNRSIRGAVLDDRFGVTLRAVDANSLVLGDVWPKFGRGGDPLTHRLPLAIGEAVSFHGFGYLMFDPVKVTSWVVVPGEAYWADDPYNALWTACGLPAWASRSTS